MKKRFDEIQARILEATKGRAYSRDKGVGLIAVSKGQSIAAIAELYALGQRDFGENYVQELAAKAEELAGRGLNELRWHFIGHLQSNKAKLLASSVAAVHSLDSESTARELARRWRSTMSGANERLPVFLEVNIDEEPAKSGVAPAQAPELAPKIDGIDGLELRGLMCVPAFGGGSGAFARLRDLELRCRPHTRGDLSMGMSGDFEEAIWEGATHVRIGTALFGPRGLASK